jgi:hypothetical protein
MDTLNEKALTKVAELLMELEKTDSFSSWEKEKEFLIYIIQQHINQSYMIDIRYYKEYTNFWHEVLIILNEL